MILSGHSLTDTLKNLDKFSACVISNHVKVHDPRHSFSPVIRGTTMNGDQGPFKDNQDSQENALPDDEIIELVKHTRKLSPDIPISFGCAKVAGKDRDLLEIGLIEAGIDSIAFPSEGAVKYAVENKIAHTFIEKCCANL